MYHPYFRGKQYELITVRERAQLLARAAIIPIIEPVKESLVGLERTLTAVCDASGSAIVIVNPEHGDLAEDGREIGELLDGAFSGKPKIQAGILLKQDTDLESVRSFVKRHAEAPVVFVHAGFTDGGELAKVIGALSASARHVFFDLNSSKLYRRHFSGGTRVLVRDGFKKRTRNADHPPLEFFSDLHITYVDEGMEGFGDFLTVGDDYSESGGPAYAVAIHLTFIDPAKENQMYIYHFVSRSRDTPTDPAGKFGEALDKLLQKLDEPNSKIFASSAIDEFRQLHARRHFPGLGYVKKLSMIHHIETLADFIGRSHG